MSQKPAGSCAPAVAKRHAIGALALLLWLALTTAVAVALLARHELALPAPSPDDARLSLAVRALQSGEQRGRWGMLHVLYARCRCSQNIVDHLTSSVRPEGLQENVWLVEDDGALTRRLEAHGFRVHATTAAELRDELHVQGVPLLVISDPEGAIRYAGGYTFSKQGADIRDLAIYAELLQQQAPSSLPLTGCAMSDELRALLDPLQLP